MKRILPLLLAVAVLSARANVLVYEGFHPADYNNVGDNTQMTPSGANVTGDYTVGLATGAWQMNGSMPKVYGTSRGLALPSAMTDAGFAVLGGSIGLNPGDDNKALRSTSHGLVAGTLNVSSGTLYVRALLNLDSKAATKLVAGEALAQKDGGYFGFGLTTGTTDYYLLTRSAASIAFVVWKNASDQYVLSLAHTTASGTAFTSYPLVTGVTLGTTYLCYAEIQVGAGSGGKEVLRAGAMASDAFTTDTPWAMIGGESDTVEVELMTDASYPTRIALAGPYGTKDGSNGYFRADEFVVGTELSDILLGSTTKPKLSDGSLALANGVYTATAALSQSDADVTYTLSDGDDATPEAPVALGAGSFTADSTATGTFAAPADDTTYEVILTAMNAGDETAELSLGTIYGGSLSLDAATDANETGLVAGGVTVSRAAADPLPLTVNYTISGSAGSEGATWAAPVAVTIPAGSASAVLPVTPISDPDVTEDVTITVSLAAGNYGLPSANAATLTLVNHRAAVPADFAKKITLTPSETALAKIGETAWTDFPVLVRLPAEASAQLQSANGTDLYVTDENDSALPFEVDTFDPAGETLVWVKVPSLSAATALTVYFGGASNQDNDPTAVWSRYVGVWHYAPSDAGGSTVADATGHGLTGSTTGALSTCAGPFGGDAIHGTATVTAPNYDALVPNAGQFTASGWFKAPSQVGDYLTFVSKKTGLNWDDAKGWYLEMAQSKTKMNLVLGNSTTSATIPDVSANWNHFSIVSDGTNVKVYMNGSTSAAITKAYAVTASGRDFVISPNKADNCTDEYRIRKGAASAAETALEYATMADAAFFDLGAIVSVDDTAQVFETPTIVRNANGTYTVTVVLSENSGDVGAIYDAGATALTNVLATAAAPGTFTDTPANLAADTTYAFAAYGKNANGTEVVAKGGVFYNGDLSIAALSNAVERGAVPGAFRVSRADAAHDLVVNLSIAGTAVAGQTYEALPTTVTIPAGATFVDVRVRPILDPETVQDATVEVSIAAGLYGVAQDAGTATVTVENLVAPTGYNVWIATSDGLASVDDNWSLGREPVESDNILFDGEFSTANCEWDTNATATVASWTQTNGYTGTVTVDTVFPGKGNFQCLTVTGPMAVMSGAITHPQSRTMVENHNAAWDWLGDLLANETYRLRLDVGSLAVGADGLLDAKGKGYLATHDSARVNASHGGRISDASPRCYGDPKEPIHIGLPDRPAGNYYNGVGGGAIYVTSAGAVVVDGVVRADSAGRDYGNNNHACGAAGSVYIQAASVSGTGTISAYGPGSADGNYKGTGGRVAIVTEQPVDRSTFASINADSARRNAQNNIANRFGGAGTVFFRDATMTHGVLVVASAETTYEAVPRDHRTDVSADGDWTFDRVELGGNVQLAVPVGTTLTLPDWNCVTAPSNASGTPSGLFYEGGTLDFGSAASVSLAGHWYFAPISNYVFNANVSLADGAAIGFGGKYTQKIANNAYPDKLDKIQCTVNGNLTIPYGCSVNVSQAGAMQDSHGVPADYPQGAHGGRRSNTMKTIGSVFHPRTLPHGQSNSYGWIIPGGAVELVVSGTLTLGGTIESTAYTGNDGTKSEVGGGSIDITAGRLAGDGSIKAGAVKDGQPGGRIAIRLTGAGATLDDFDGTINCATMGANSVGSCGSVYIQTAADGEGRGTVILDDNNVTCTTYTPICATGYEADDVADFRHADLLVRNEAKAQVSVAGANGAFRMDGIEIDETGALDLFGNVFTVTSARVAGRNVPPGTYTAAQLASLGFSQVVDTADGAGGTLRVLGAATVLIVK